jgi:hypothetical protein
MSQGKESKQKSIRRHPQAASLDNDCYIGDITNAPEKVYTKVDHTADCVFELTGDFLFGQVGLPIYCR